MTSNTGRRVDRRCTNGSRYGRRVRQSTGRAQGRHGGSGGGNRPNNTPVMVQNAWRHVPPNSGERAAAFRVYHNRAVGDGPFMVPRVVGESAPFGYELNSVFAQFLLELHPACEAPFTRVLVGARHKMGAVLRSCQSFTAMAQAGQRVLDRAVDAICHMMSTSVHQHQLNEVWRDPCGDKIAPVLATYAQHALSAYKVRSARFDFWKRVQDRVLEINVSFVIDFFIESF